MRLCSMNIDGCVNAFVQLNPVSPCPDLPHLPMLTFADVYIIETKSLKCSIKSNSMFCPNNFWPFQSCLLNASQEWLRVVSKNPSCKTLTVEVLAYVFFSAAS